MPGISEFYGIFVYMYYNEHGIPHFHAIYGGEEAVFAIENGSVLAGHTPRRAEKMIIEWIELHRNELLKNWRLARDGEQLAPIAPLD